jgi:hypothetical protein
MILVNLASIPAAGTYVTTPLQIRQAPNSQGEAMAVCAEFNFVWGSGGTTLDAYIQTSLNAGTTWVDAINFHAALASLHTVAAVSSTTSMTVPVAVTDGAQSPNSVTPGLVGSWWRLKYTVAGTYLTSTLRIDIEPVMVPAGVGSFN